MTQREKIAHLLRRFGLGASLAELDYYEKLGVEGTLDRLINYEKVDEGFNLSIVNFALQQNDMFQLRPEGVASHWVFRMMVTQRPLQEKLTAFWHDHFAISASKANNGYMSYQYLETLRSHANGNFHDLLLAVSQCPDMIQWLDNNTNVKGKPNENFAREVMELFTVGIGNYSEKDIQEASRAFTGWSFRRNARGRLTPEEAKSALKENKKILEFQFRPLQHDNGTKVILGNEGQFGGEDVLGILVGRKETGRYISSKLWSWFAYENPEPALLDRLSKVYFDSGFSIKSLLRAIATSDEFWSSKCVRKQIKSPLDFSISIVRQLGLGQFALSLAGDFGPEDRLPVSILGLTRGTYSAMDRQGMKLLFPPDVAGWDWGNAWISSATMVERIKFADVVFGGAAVGGRALQAAPYFSQLLSERPLSSAKEAVELFLKLLDTDIPSEKRSTLEKALNSVGGASALNQPRSAVDALRAMGRLLFAMPEFQLC